MQADAKIAAAPKDVLVGGNKRYSLMRKRVSRANSKIRIQTVRSWSSPSEVVMKEKKGGSAPNAAIAAAGLGRVRSASSTGSPAATRRSVQSLREELYELIEGEAVRMNGMRVAYSATAGHEQLERAFFSSAELIRERLERLPGLGPQERQFLMCAIQAVGFALATESMQEKRSNRRRHRRAKWVANILSDAMEQNQLAFLRSELLAPGLLDRLSSD